MTTESRRQELYALLGELPERNRPVSATLDSHESRRNYELERLTLDLNGTEPVPALFVHPKGKSGPWPTVLYCHAHGGNYPLGKNELINGMGVLQDPPYAGVLAGRGIAALCIDAWLFGERSGRSESSLFKEMLWTGRVVWGMMVYDLIKAIDYLTTRKDVDSDRIATLGMSMGSTAAWWVSALDGRIRLCIDICCLTEFNALIDSNGLDGHGIYYYVPNLVNHFTTSEINALIAPRPHLGLAGNLDSLTPPAGLDRIDREMQAIYKQRGVPERWEMHREDVAHQETPEMRRKVLEFLDRWI